MDRIRPALATLVGLGAFSIGAVPALAQTSNPFAAPSQQPPQEEMILSVTPDQMASLLQDMGYRAEIATNDQGKRRIRTRIAGRNAAINFYSCDDGENCKSIGIRSFFTNPKKNLDFVNKWNQEKRFSKAYIDNDNDVNIEYDVIFRDGVTKGNIRAHFNVFEDQLKEFAEKL